METENIVQDVDAVEIPVEIDTAEDTTEDANPPTEAEVLAELQAENQRLWDRIKELSSLSEHARQSADLLKDAQHDNQNLRLRYGQIALSEALRQGAESLGIPAELAEMYTGKFTCQIDADGQAVIEPNPTEFLLAELKNDPLLQHSAQQSKQKNQATAIANGIVPVDEADPSELISVLDRDPGAKARFIARCGMPAFIDLAAKAARKGYRR